ncbi:adhesion regulating molecule [Auriscalpium vulgare]|uniref:Adhesion regulating molecule n=1 Tax=Auriscalpium vulgare TaxID=40419 RepID=A0ACB8S1F8_9AGAM|nr:adhesion regulating molecule [Auriscalpium vulgare]
MGIEGLTRRARRRANLVSTTYSLQQSAMPLVDPFSILAFKAGRAFRREGTNTVEPSPVKGAIVIERGEDDLLHLLWKNRETEETDEDLIVFPEDASFVRVEQATGGRIYVLKFTSSEQRHFFWLQDASSERDEEFVLHVNNLLQIPGYVPEWNTTTEPQTSGASSSQSAAPAAQSSASQPTPEQLAQLRALVNQMSGTVSAEPEVSLIDILTPANLGPLFTSHPELVSSIFPHLPPDLPVPPSPEVLSQIVSSPQFRGAVVSLDRALRTGLLGGLMSQLGLPAEAGTSVEAFLRAIREQAGQGPSGPERMDTD